MISVTDITPGNDIIKKFDPHERQKHFLELPDSVYEALYGGGAYGGKSFLLTLLFIIRGFYKYRGAKGILFRREMTDLEKENIRLTQEWFPATGGIYNENKKAWHWPEYGSYFDFAHIQHLKDLKSYDTLQYNLAIFEELTHFLEAMYLYIVGSRVRPSSTFNVAIVRNSTNPGGVGQTFVYNRFVRPCESGYSLLRDSKTGLRRIFIPALYQDNPYGMQFDPDYGNKLEILPEAEKRAKKYGDWHAYEGSVFTTFRPIRFPNEPDNALHVCEYFDIPEWWPRILSVDWGKRAMCHAMWAAISPSNRLYIYRERTWKGVDVPFWAAEVGQLSEYDNLVVAVLCGSAFQDHGVDTIAQEANRHSGIRFISSQNYPGTRVATLQIVQEFMRWEQKPYQEPDEPYDHGKATEIFRKFGDEALSNYVNSYKKYEEEDNLPKLQILLQPGVRESEAHDRTLAQVLVDTIPACIYDEKKKEDIAEFDGDDPIDNLRNLCKFSSRYMNGLLGEEVQKRKQVQSIVEEYQKTGDTTRFYRRMEHMESAEGNESYGVRRAISRRY